MGSPQRWEDLIDPTELKTVGQVARIMNVTPATVRTWLREGKLKGTQINSDSPQGRRWRISVSALQEFVSERYGSD